MTRPGRYIPFLWLLVASQCLAVLLGPRGLWICRETDGSAHMEWVGSSCCETSGSATLSPQEGFCAPADCLDEPIDRHMLVRDGRVSIIAALSLAPAPPHWLLPESGLANSSVPRFGACLRAACGPPGPEFLSLRTTVLRL